MTVSGKYRKGCGKAHRVVYQHDTVFGQRMVGTFNVFTGMSIEAFVPSMSSGDGGFRYWRVIVDGRLEAWAVRRRGTKMPPRIWELMSREPLPEELRTRRFDVEVQDQEQGAEA